MTCIFFRTIWVIFLLALATGCKDSEETDALQTDNEKAEEIVTDDAIDDQKRNYDHLTLNISNPWSFSTIKQGADKDLLVASISHDQNYLEIWSVNTAREIHSLDREDTGYHPDDVNWVDWDGDGNVAELLVTVEGKKEIQLWIYDDQGLHQEAAVKVEDAPQNVEIADLDLDGQLDMVIGPYSGERLTVFWGKSDFNFDPAYLDTFPIPVYPKLTDWNHDGLTDIIWSDWKAGSVQWAQNLGKREFSIHMLQEKGPGAPRQVVPGDLDNDGDYDLIITLEAGKAARIFYNDGQGNIEKIENIPAPTSGYSSAAITQYEKKTMLALSESDRVILALSEGKNQWLFRQLPVIGFFPNLQFIDVDEDGIEDIICADSSSDDIEIVFGPLWDVAEELEF